MHTVADQLTLLECWYGVRVGLTPDGMNLDVEGPPFAVEAVLPMLRRRKQDFLAYLRARSSAPGVVRAHIVRTGPHA